MASLSRSSMRPDPEDLAQLQASYRLRRGLLVMATVVWGMALIAGLFTFAADAPSWFLGALVALWLLCAAVGIGAWRCPRCSEPFGRTWSVPRCPHCFVELERTQSHLDQRSNDR